MRGGWNQINTALREAFEGVSLAAMAFPTLPEFAEAAPAPLTNQ
jgi:hypothetical protein